LDFQNGIAFINPIYNAFPYARRAAFTFFKHTPAELNPVCFNIDDHSPGYKQQDWDSWHRGLPVERCVFHRFGENGGLTRSWNYGLDLARKAGCKYAIAGNSDILFTEGWYESLIYHLDNGMDMVAPVTNAPGWTERNSQRQNVRNYYPDYQLDDDSGYLTKVARYLKENYPIEQIERRDVNGFFMMGTIDSWWDGAFDAQHVFDPRHRMTFNEDELQLRWKRKSKKVGFIPSSFVFHYRSVSRGDKHKHTGWMRPENPQHLGSE
jgi:GT2 family glycosyltransferase